MLNEESVWPSNEYTYSSLLSSCADLAAIHVGKEIHACIIKSVYGMESDTFVVSSLMQIYAKCGCLEEARIIFEEMPKRDLASWNTMIVHSLHGFAHEAIEVFQQSHKKEDVQPNDITMVAIPLACGRDGVVEKGYKYFKTIRQLSLYKRCHLMLMSTFGHCCCLLQLCMVMSILENIQPNN
jgi:pentatricopeptide repeat protein